MTATPDRAEHFRPDVEGLRAVAVLLVLLYHAHVPGFPGGYVGVDVFFVISGFLITGLILRELDATGRVSLTTFYARRARRLLPASALTLLVTLGASVLLLSAVRIPDVATDIASAAAYVSNFRFGIQANDYFQANAAPSPVLHFWSLSVEEQFYLFWPTILLILSRLSGRLRAGRRGLFVGLTMVSIASLVGCIWLTDQNQPWAFYLLPTRAWELGLGALLAVSAGRVRLPGRRTPAALVAAGLAGIALATVTFTDDTLFPGYAAMLPVVGAGLVILGGSRASLPARLLSLPPCQFLGRVSYAIYLWHWPMLVFAGVIYGTTLPLPLSVLVALASIPVAAITQRIVEQPFRIGCLIGTRPRINLGQALVSTLALVLAAAGATVYARTQVDAMLGGLIPPLSQFYQPIDGAECPDPSKPENCRHGTSGSPVRVVLFGDSIAGTWFPAMADLAKQHDWDFISLVRSACPSAMIDVIDPNLKRVDPECAVWREAALQRIQREEPDLVILANLYLWKPVGNGSSVGRVPAWRAGLQQTIESISASESAVVVLGAIPYSAGYSLDCIIQNAGAWNRCARRPSGTDWWQAMARDVASQMGATFIDVMQWLCDGDVCPAVIGKYIVYRDAAHPTGAFLASLAPKLDSLISSLVGGLSGVSVPAISPSGHLETTPPIKQGVLTDTFSRSVSVGWGEPESGPAWEMSGSAGRPPDDASVDAGSGRMTITAAPGGAFQRAPLSARDLAISARWSLDALPAGVPVTVHLWPRVVDAGDQYRFYVTVTPSGDLFATFTAAVGGTGTALGPAARVGSGYTSGEWWHVRVEATGSGPTTLRARLWKDGTPEPSGWALEVSDATPNLQADSRAVQLGVYAGAGEITLPLHAAFDDVFVTATATSPDP